MPQINIQLGEITAIINFESDKELNKDEKIKIIKILRGEILTILKLKREFPYLTLKSNGTLIWDGEKYLSRPGVFGGIYYE